jgi:hypothetical protein
MLTLVLWFDPSVSKCAGINDSAVVNSCSRRGSEVRSLSSAVPSHRSAAVSISSSPNPCPENDGAPEEQTATRQLGLRTESGTAPL